MKPVSVRPLTTRSQYAAPKMSRLRSVSLISCGRFICHGHSTGSPLRVNWNGTEDSASARRLTARYNIGTMRYASAGEYNFPLRFIVSSHPLGY